MATQDDDLRRLEDEGAAVALQAGADPGQLAAQLAGTHTAAMGAGMANRYAQMGARWLADPMPTRLDGQLLDRLMRQGFRRESLDNVRIHRGPKAQQAATALGARAFAIGDQDIFFGQGEFDPHSRSGRAVIAHELAHVAPPDLPGGNAPAMGGTIPTSFGGGSLGGLGAPVLNERKRGDEDAAGSEAHERQAREAERRVYAQEDTQAPPQMASGPMEGGGQGGHGAEAPKMSESALEAKVLAIIGKWERTEIERSGAF